MANVYFIPRVTPIEPRFCGSYTFVIDHLQYLILVFHECLWSFMIMVIHSLAEIIHAWMWSYQAETIHAWLWTYHDLFWRITVNPCYGNHSCMAVNFWSIVKDHGYAVWQKSFMYDYEHTMIYCKGSWSLTVWLKSFMHSCELTMIYCKESATHSLTEIIHA